MYFSQSNFMDFPFENLVLTCTVSIIPARKVYGKSKLRKPATTLICYRWQ